MAAAGPVGPGRVDLDGLFEGGVRQLGGDAPDRRRVDAGFPGGRFRRVLRVLVTVQQQLEGGHRGAAQIAAVQLRQIEAALQGRRNIGCQGARQFPGVLVDGQGVAVGVAHEHPVMGLARRAVHQPGGVGVAHQKFQIDLAGAQQFVHQRQYEQTVGAGPHAEPFVGDGGIAGAYRIDGNEFGVAFGLEFAQASLDGIGIVVLGDAEHQEIAGVLPIRLAELPERTADSVEAGGGHVDRAKAAMGGVVGGAELACPEPRQPLALVAAGEKRQLARVAPAHVAEPFGGCRQRFVPFDLDEFVGAARSDPLQGLRQPRRRVMLHDAGRPFGAQHALVDRMIAVAFDVADGAVAQMHVDAAPAGAHVAGRGLNLVADRRRGVDVFGIQESTLGHVIINHTNGEARRVNLPAFTGLANKGRPGKAAALDFSPARYQRSTGTPTKLPHSVHEPS